MNTERKFTFSTCLLALVITMAPVLSTSSLETNSASSVDRIKRRSYYNPWSPANKRNSVSLYEASNIFRPAPYRIPRPYYIPVYGTQGRPLIFYPPQPLYVNPGMPLDNPLTPSSAVLGYLPPKESPHFTGGDKYLPPKKGTGTVSRFGDDDEIIDQDDPNAPVWGGSSGGMVQMPLSGDQEKESGPIPTRAPMTKSTLPPLVHDTQISGQSSGFAAPQRPPVIPTELPQSIQRSTLRTTTTPSPKAGPSNCVWAIISCCSASNPTILPQNCFEQRGCPGPFWGASPCDSDYARAAIVSANNYYNMNPGASIGK